MAEQPELAFHNHVLRTLNRLSVPYMVIGAFAGSLYGITRVTFDVEIVVDLRESHVEALAAAYPPTRYYADPRQMRDSIRYGILFNIIDASAGRKVDFIPVTMPLGYAWLLQRRIRMAILLNQGITFDAWFARPDDVLVTKLMAWKEGRSFKHEQDIRDILVAVKLGEDTTLVGNFDIEYVTDWARRLGPDVFQSWLAMLEAIGL
ncbi:MAG: hypothetical protein RML36_04365 [Anaerolineae bacterium]|nr:hypothetical protein [Anaerolineae bacterium]MDW8098706.1 hypothetical protein [Anaerolineae bacterium]